MFRKPKKTNKGGIRRKTPTRADDDDDDEEDQETLQELAQARKRAKKASGSKDAESDDDEREKTTSKKKIMHTFQASENGPVSQKELATSTNEHHPTKAVVYQNKFLAGPIKATTNIRTTCRFDYQPDICKDYKDTGFCGFGDTCIYLHDRGDTLSGWQLEQQWEQQQAAKKQQQDAQMEAFMNGGKNNNNNISSKEGEVDDTDGLPFACHLCRKAFQDPVITACGHYFCQSCILTHVQETSQLCPICNKDTHGVFNQPTKLLSKKRKLVGRDATWETYLETCQKTKGAKQEDNIY